MKSPKEACVKTEPRDTEGHAGQGRKWKHGNGLETPGFVFSCSL